jgi:dihydropteroate synthase
MHMQGEPRTMQADPRYDDVASEVAAFLEERMRSPSRRGSPRS